ncbi:putative bifunctional diguanylate cyclase/phosphodiesterase [Allosphingosinicella sp.]|uniref:putative bifunctional diguanylate cyclase/phosphodiesterase n=1 Tax=Allosphingosinicella sp. TaxID=2823234 RepID=UPI002FC0EA1E
MFDLARLSPLFARWRRRVIFWLPGLLGLFLLLSGAGTGLDQLLRNMRDGIRSHPASGEIHIVEIDARSLAEFGKWPLPRRIHAAAIDRLHRAGARSIAFDVDFSATSRPAEDDRLAAALERARGSVVLPTFRQYAGSNSSHYVDNIPIKSFKENAFLAAVNVFPDPDGYIRHMPLGLDTAGVPRPSLASMVAERQAGIGRQFRIDYAIEPSSIPRHSLVDLVSGNIPDAALAGKRVVIGATAVEMGDRYAVPRHGVIPGVVIQVLAAETLLAGPVPRQWSAVYPLLLALIFVAASLGIRSRRLGSAFFVVSTLGVLTLPLATEALFSISLPLAPALAVLAAAALLSGAAFVAEQYLRRALTDEATGLPNLAALEIATARAPANVVVARIDRFAAIASGLGPDATARLVLRVAERLGFAKAETDIYRTDEASLAWIERPGDEESLDDRIDAIAAVMRSPVECGRLVDVTLAFGLATAEHGNAKQLVANASLAAFHASQKGIRWERFVDADSDETNWHLSLLGELDAAMESGQLWNAYQPKLDIRSGQIVGVEALVRWMHPERGPIAPDSFVPLVEEHGRARDLTVHVLEQALEDAFRWSEEGHPIGVAVNVSATLLRDHEFIELVGQILARSAVPTGRVTIEVTESAAMNSPEQAIAALESWRALGVAISIDDYGTGQSSLGYLQKLPATELKIDKSFIQTICTDSRNAIMVRSTVALAHELGMKVVAEGIEEAACLHLLEQMGCDTGQGYFIGRPMSAKALLDFLSERSREAA